MTTDEVSSLKEWLDERMDAQAARFETSILRAFNEHRDHDHVPLTAQLNAIEKQTDGDRKLARGGLLAVSGFVTFLETLRHFFGGATPPHH